LGIASDRIADTLFEKWWNNKLRTEQFPDRSDYYAARRIILTRSGRLSDLLEYGRSRLRICRGWALNATLIVVALNLLIWIRMPGPRLALSLFGTVAGFLFAISSWYSWRNLSITEYRKVKEQAAFLAAEERLSAKHSV
jgi:hypothetical protein